MTGNEIERYEPSSRDIEVRPPVDSWTDVFRPIVALAEHVAGTDFVPRGLRGNPAATAAAMLFGRELGMGPMKALQNVHVIDGTPTLKPQEMRGMVLAAGHALSFREHTKHKCVIAGRRRGDTEWTVVEWTMQDARDMRLHGKPNWQRFPRQMLVARCTGELCRMIFADVIGGAYTPEEIADGAVPTELPAQLPAAPEADPAPKKAKRRTPTTKPAAVAQPPLSSIEEIDEHGQERMVDADDESEGDRPPLPGEITDAELIDDDTPALISPAQMRKLQAFFTEHDIRDRSHKLEIARAITGRGDLHSSTDLTAREASQLIDTLARLAHQSGGADFLRALDLLMSELGARAVTDDENPPSGTEAAADQAGNDDNPDKEATP